MSRIICVTECRTLRRVWINSRHIVRFYEQDNETLVFLVDKDSELRIKESPVWLAEQLL